MARGAALVPHPFSIYSQPGELRRWSAAEHSRSIRDALPEFEGLKLRTPLRELSCSGPRVQRNVE